ncbi:MAG TPA: hypothetical protein VD837_09500 [Terriglobales bacterium]|nr:hypothetical protein [Terriglobales bacterium]
MFMETVSNDQAKKYIAAGRKAWEFKTKDVSKGPIFGPAYDDSAAMNRAKKENRYAETVEAAQKIAKGMGTDISSVSFLERE